MATITVPHMRKFVFRLCWVLLGLAVLAVWLPALLWAVLSTFIAGGSVRQAAQDTWTTLRDISRHWREAMIDPFGTDPGESSGV